jgi:AcrR family transcriptional regulator
MLTDLADGHGVRGIASRPPSDLATMLDMSARGGSWHRVHSPSEKEKTLRNLLERSDIVPLLADIFRDLGYDGATLARISERTGIGKGSLYHFFPGGKHEMAKAVLAEIDDWFEHAIFTPLRQDEPGLALEEMWRAIETYYQFGQRTCLFASFSIDGARERFSWEISSYFCRWIDALCSAIYRSGIAEPDARRAAEVIVCDIQGALVLARALDETAAFIHTLARLRATSLALQK